jgi:hypothetical protein
VEVAGVPPGKIHEYLDAVVLVPKETVPPADIVTFEVLAESDGARGRSRSSKA